MRLLFYKDRDILSKGR